MPERGSPTVRRRRLGYELRQLREAAWQDGEQAAAALGWSDSKVSRIETGRITVTWGDVSPGPPRPWRECRPGPASWTGR